MPEYDPSKGPEHAFAEPWQAQLFAVTLKLSQAGHFTWTEWTEHFGARLRRAAAESADDARPMPEVDSVTYYDVWLAALESLLIQRGVARAEELARLKQAWTDAYLNTPHGKPVELRRLYDHNHDHAAD